MLKYVILKLNIIFLISFMATGIVTAETALQKKIDSLFVYASSGEVRYRDLVEPGIDSIAALGVQAVPALINKFDTKSARERLTIIKILKKIGSDAVPDLIVALNRPDDLVVARVCWALGDIKDSSAVSPLMSIAVHNSWWVREKAIDALGKIKDIKAEAVIINSLSDPIGQVRKAAVVAAGKINIQNGKEQLIHALGDEFYGARKSAVTVLAAMDTTEVLSIITDSINSSNNLLGNNACHLLELINTDISKELLFDQSKVADPLRRAHAAIALIQSDPEDRCGYRQEILNNETDRFVLMKMQSALDDIIHVR